MGLVQNMVVSSPRDLRVDVVDSSSFRSVRPGDRIEDKMVCPVPRRVLSVQFSAGEHVKPFCLRRSVPPPTLDCEANLELLEILRSKNSSLTPASFGCLTPFYSGSPPSRTGNPIVHDAEFVQHSRIRSQHAKIPPSHVVKGVECTNRKPEFSSRSPCQSKSSISTPIYKSSPRVRVEGFDCPSHGFDCASRDTRRHVAAVA